MLDQKGKKNGMPAIPYMNFLILSFAISMLVYGESKPNIILIMADDMGYEALSSNGSESCKTPNLDHLASTGLRFDNAFANPLCTPSRVKIMTGQYNVRNYVSFGRLDRHQKTFAHQLKAEGYRTCIAGKWQLGNESDSPQHFGFDEALLWQHVTSGRTKIKKKKIDRRFVNPLLEHNGKAMDFSDGEYGPQLCADFICDFIEENKTSPFLVYYPMILTHYPFDPTPDSKDWDPKRPGSMSYKGDLNDPQRHFVDMVSYTDKIVGQIVAQLEKSGVRNNTLVIFTGDNGTDKPIVTSWKGKKIAGGKGQMSDTGTRVPFVVNWPSKVKNPGRAVDDLVEFSDVMPTLCEVAGAKLPKGYPNDGQSLMPTLSDQVGEREKDHIYIWYRGKVMVRNKSYSLLANSDGKNPRFMKHQGPFASEELEVSNLQGKERELKDQFMRTLQELSKTRPKTLKVPKK